ncbi:MAG: polyprenyl synthetase family protein [Actinomycetota bacterium]|nr:polyprenyl synthetase family protein [Actinomycetota bacterium]
MPELPPAVALLRERLEFALDSEIDGLWARLVRLHPNLAPLADELRAFVLRGGKRLRPLFVLLGFEAAGGGDPQPVMGPALALELLHTCALVHDDVIDRAALRRGRPAVHAAFAQRLALAVGPGCHDRYGEAAAILLGDLAFVQADELFLRSGVAPARLLSAFKVFTAMREEVTAGQFLDVEAASSGATSVELALSIARYKSGSYSVARPLQIGAALADGGDRIAERLAAAGLPLGQAFQLRDDVLSVFGAEAEIGKPTASDLSEGKRTLLVALTAERLDPPSRARFDSLLGRPNLSNEQADELRGLMRASGGLAATERWTDELFNQAMQELEALPIKEEARRSLRDLALYLVARNV